MVPDVECILLPPTVHSLQCPLDVRRREKKILIQSETDIVLFVKVRTYFAVLPALRGHRKLTRLGGRFSNLLEAADKLASSPLEFLLPRRRSEEPFCDFAGPLRPTTSPARSEAGLGVGVVAMAASVASSVPVAAGVSDAFDPAAVWCS